jgi:hypothetical protein
MKTRSFASNNVSCVASWIFNTKSRRVSSACDFQTRSLITLKLRSIIQAHIEKCEVDIVSPASIDLCIRRKKREKHYAQIVRLQLPVSTDTNMLLYHLISSVSPSVHALHSDPADIPQIHVTLLRNPNTQ